MYRIIHLFSERNATQGYDVGTVRECRVKIEEFTFPWPSLRNIKTHALFRLLQ
jgi:hypothetical protein